MDWKANETKDRLVIFTERIETLLFLQQQLTQDLKLKAGQVEILHGSLSDTEQQRIVEDFGQENCKVRLLLCSDVASECINLHYLSHRMVHFDIPWSLMVFQQRNGRIDRYGQEQAPQIYYLMTEVDNKSFKDDNRILEILIEKDEQAIKNIGDPSVFMGVYDSEEEEKITARAIEQGLSGAEFDQQLQPKTEDFDFFAEDWFASDTEQTHPDPQKEIGQTLSLFGSDYDYLAKGIQRVAEREQRDRITQLETDDKKQRIAFTAPASLEQRFKHLSKEIWPKDGHFILSAQQSAINDAIKESRQSEQSWPLVHYLWGQHPVFQWINNKVASHLRRQQAPVIKVGNKLKADESVFITYSLIANQKGQPLIQQWLGVYFLQDKLIEIKPLEDVLVQMGLQGGLPNSGEVDASVAQLNKRLPQAIAAIQKQMHNVREQFEQENRPKLDAQLEKLKILEGKHFEQLDLFMQNNEQIAGLKDKKEQQEKQAIRSRFDEYRQWIHDTMNTEDKPYIQIVAAMIH